MGQGVEMYRRSTEWGIKMGKKKKSSRGVGKAEGKKKAWGRGERKEGWVIKGEG